MLFWKLLVAVDLLIAAGYWWAVWTGQERLQGYDVVGIPVGIIGSAGLIIYAFSLPPMWQLFWRLFLPIFIGSGAWEISSAVKNDRLEPATIAGASAGILLVGLTSVALYRLGGSHWLGA